MDIKTENLAKEIERNIDSIISLDSDMGKELWDRLHSLHPAEVALVFNDTADECVLRIFKKMGEDLAFEIFSKLSVPVQAHMVSHFDSETLTYLFRKLQTDQITTILEEVPDKDMERYLKLTNKKRQLKILSSLKYDDKSAGRMLNSDVVILQKELTIHKAVSLFQRVGDKFEILPRQYVVDGKLKLVGFIEISDLLKRHPNTKIESILRPIDAKVLVHDHQEDVADAITHYELLSIPVVDEQDHFLGVITANDVLDILDEEQTEDSYKMSGSPNIEHSYACTGFWTIVIQRCKWLVPLLLFQSISSIIIDHYEGMLSGFGLIGFLTMLTGTGGNVGNQSATFFVRGLATGDINRKNKSRLVFREIFISFVIGLVLVAFASVRVFFTVSSLPSVFAILSSLLLIVAVSVFLGTVIPVALDHLEVDPANSAAPFIATLMDILGVTIYCLIASFMLS